MSSLVIAKSYPTFKKPNISKDVSKVLALYCGSYIIRKNNMLHMLMFGAVAGTVVEYLGSFVQETLFGSVSWDYSRVPLNIGVPVVFYILGATRNLVV